MKILLTTHFYPPHNSGLGNAVQLQAMALASHGIEVVVATGKLNAFNRKNSENDIKIEEFKISGSNSLIYPLEGEINKYVAFLQNGNFDIIIMNAWQTWATDIVLLNLDTIPGKKYLYSHCISTNVFMRPQPLRSIIRYLGWRPYRWKLRSYIEQLDGIIFLSSGGNDSRFDDLKIARKTGVTIQIIPNSLSSEAIDALEKPSMDMSARTQIISVGSYQWQKGFDFVLRAYAKSSAKNKVPLKLFGLEHTKYLERLNKLSDHLKIDRDYVDFQVGIAGKALLKEYRNSCLFISGSHTECQPLVLLDANATGTPFIARNTGCISKMSGGTTVDTAKEAAFQIDALLSDELKWNALNQAGRSAANEVYHPNITSIALLKALEIDQKKSGVTQIQY
ncbi:MAG: glycosyltransferase family 4 protein [Cohaesibacteraceae bacterium]|nr:glycosyltransferase family 4 protein [Cohaesibacteraceae bacterium]